MRSFVSMINSPNLNEMENVIYEKFRKNKFSSCEVRAIALKDIPEGTELLAK